MSSDDLKQDEFKIHVAAPDVGAAPSPVVAAKKTAGRFLLQAKLSSGTYGALWKAIDPANGGVVAVKVLNVPETAAGGFRSRLQTEAEQVMELTHPSMVPVVDFGDTADGASYVAYEYVAGPTLLDIVQSRSNVGRVELLGYFVAACEAVSHAHLNGVVHRKLALDKIFVSEGGEDVRVGGFATGWIGDPSAADPREDVYDFGKMMQKAFFNRQPSPEIDAVIAHCLSDISSDRYKDCGELLSALLSITSGDLPAPPQERTGQRFMKPPVIAGIGLAVVFLTWLIVFASGLLNTHAPTSVTPTATTMPATPLLDVPAKPHAPSAVPSAAPVASGDPYGLNDSTPSSAGSPTHIISKTGMKTGAITGVAAAAAAYETMTPEQRARAKEAAMRKAQQAVQQWQTMSAQDKQQLKSSGMSFARKALGIWKKMPNQ